MFRRIDFRFAWLVGLAALAGGGQVEGADDDPVSAWRTGVVVRDVFPEPTGHTVHSYFNTNPESPDGRRVLLFRSDTPEGHEGDVCIVERESGTVKVLARGVVTEDAHRVACQQWICNGEKVVFHDLRAGQWVVAAVDVASKRETVLAEGRQLCWGQPAGDVVPLYGPHWQPGEHRGIELLDVRTGAIRKVLDVETVRSDHSDWIDAQYGDEPVSLFFPILSPDGRRVMFKLASPLGGDFRSGKASKRLGLFCYNLDDRSSYFMNSRWGHPAWHPNSRRILNYSDRGVFLVDPVTGTTVANDNLPAFPGSHPSLSPDGELFVTDLQIKSLDGESELWAVAVGSLKSGTHAMLHRFENGEGARSWRRSHPHPVFSADGRRVYFNVSDGPWTRLHVAERTQRESP
jgi:Tol biopolymer transport system component